MIDPLPQRRVALSLLVLFALGACGHSRGGSPPPASLIPPFDVTVVADRYTSIPGTPITLTASSKAALAPVTFTWQLADGRAVTGATATLTFDQPGSFVSTVVATDASGRIANAEMLTTVFPSSGGANGIGLLGVPRPTLPGDVDGDGSLSLQDALRLSRLAARSESATEADQVLRADADLDGRIGREDVDHVAGALDAGADLPVRLVPVKGAPGCLVRVTAAALLDPAANVTVRVGGGQEVLIDRVELGRGAFLVPLDATAGRTEVVVAAGSAITAFDFEVLPAYSPTAAPGDLFRRIGALGDLARPLARQGLLAYLEEKIPEQMDRQILLSLWDEAQAQLLANQAQVESVMSALPTEVVALLEQVAVANGLLAQIASGESMAASVPSGTAALLLSDAALEALCWLSEFKRQAATVTWASPACEWASTAAAIVLAAIAVGATPTGLGSAAAITALTALVATCTAAAVPLAVTEVVAEYAPDVATANLNLVADPSVLQLPTVTQSQLRVSLTVPIAPELRAGTGSLATRIVTKAVQRVFAKAPLIRVISQLIRLLPNDLERRVRDRIESVVSAAVGAIIDSSGIGVRLDAVSAYLSSLTEAYGATIDPNGVLMGPLPAIGTLQLAPPGTELPSIYTCDPTQPVTVGFVASKSICGTQRATQAVVSFGLRSVTITMGDNGSLLDDIFAVEIEGQTVLTSSVPVVATSTVVQLPVGDHEVIMRGLAAPDGIGTYYIQFNGASVLAGSSATSGTNLVPGTFKTFQIRVQ